MDGPFFVLSILINQIKLVNVLCDTGCLFYGIINLKFVTKCGLKRMKINFRNIKRYNGSTNGVCNEIISIRFDINGHVENSFCYIVFKLKYDLILWMKKNGVQYHFEPERLWIRFFKMEIENIFKKNNQRNWTVCKYRQRGFTCSQKN